MAYNQMQISCATRLYSSGRHFSESIEKSRIAKGFDRNEVKIKKPIHENSEDSEYRIH